MFSLGSLFTQLFAKEKKARADASRHLLVERIASQGQKAFVDVARRTGLTASAVIGVKGPSLSGELRGVELEVALAENRDEGLMMRFSAVAQAARPMVVNVSPKPTGLFALFRKPTGVGDPEFDEVFTTRASSLSDARVLLDERGRSTLLSLPDRMPMYFDYRDGSVILDVSGVELDPDRITFVLEWLVTVASGRPEGEKPYRG